MAYDARDGYIVLFGGVGTSGNLLNDSWAFESGKTEWVKLTPALSPSPRCNASVVFDAKDDYLVLFGGAGTHGPLSDTWRFAGGKWKELTLSKFPPARSAAGATYDPNAEKVLLFGGEGPSGPLGDTWAFSGGHWTEQSRGGTGLPPARDGASFAYDPLVSSDLLLGGFNHSGPASEVWAYSNGGWAPSSAPASIIGRLSAGFTFDGIDSIMFLVGGTNLSSDGFVADSWTNSSSGWTQLTYPAHFSESGLPPGTIWGVSVGTPEVESSLSDLVLSLPVGSYEYLVEPPTGWQVVGGPASGSFVITGASEPYVSVDFAAT
jgi:hypothetical protein